MSKYETSTTWGQAKKTTVFKRVDEGRGLTEAQWGYVKTLGTLVALGIVLGAVQAYYPGGIYGLVNFGVDVICKTVDAGLGFGDFITLNIDLKSGTDFTDIATGPGGDLPGLFTP